MLPQYSSEVAPAPHVAKHHPRPHHEEKRDEQKQHGVSEHSEKPEIVERQEVLATASAPVIKKPAVTNALNDRQKKIMQFFNKRKGENVRLKEVAQFFPDLTDRTVRNDLRDLCMKKMVSRSEGHGQASFYRLAKNGIEEGGDGGAQ